MALFQQQAGAQFEPRLVTLFNAILPQILQIQDDWSEREPGEDVPHRASAHASAQQRDG